MKIEQYIAALIEIAMDHPDADMMANDSGDDYREPITFEAIPVWSERDKVVYVAYGNDD